LESRQRLSLAYALLCFGVDGTTITPGTRASDDGAATP
jgi:hypothetical protein